MHDASIKIVVRGKYRGFSPAATEAAKKEARAIVTRWPATRSSNSCSSRKKAIPSTSGRRMEAFRGVGTHEERSV